MIKKSYDGLKYTNYSQYNLINVWATDDHWEKWVERKLLNDPSFKLEDLMQNPVYKHIGDKIVAKH